MSESYGFPSSVSIPTCDDHGGWEDGGSKKGEMILNGVCVNSVRKLIAKMWALGRKFNKFGMLHKPVLLPCPAHHRHRT